jgi:hypothetical protein
MAIFFKILRNGDDFSCKADDGPSFFVGRRVPYKGNIGLYNVFAGSKLEKLNYLAADFQQLYGFWSAIIEPTAMCEGRNFLTLNTYDRAAFTFGFAQFAAHVENGDFVKYFRAMLGLPEARDYFPNLGVVGGRICKTDGAVPLPLENDHTTKPLMNYLNPDLSEVQDSEVVAAAKLIRWTSASVAARAAQVSEMIDVFKGFMTRADHRLNTDGRPASQLCVIADILHQGRGGWPTIQQAFKSASPFESLIKIGAPEYDGRKKTLKNAINANPELAARKWSSAQQDFI